MGVKGLWNILSELAERKELKHLKGKKVAIDLSGWIVQALQCKGLNTAKNPHLRNLFFRLFKLLKNGCLPVFVTEGEIPKIKEDTFKERNHYEKSSNCKKVSRKKFNRKAKECEELLKSLGVPCIKSSGEAEALCAFLCANHVVDGVITEDSDAFLYGADPVYRDFTVDSSDSHINQYSLKSEKNKRKLDRNKLISLALLLGCDYLKGVSGIGEKAALDLISDLSDCDVLQRFKDWKILKDIELFPGYEADSPKKLSHCTRCNHTGTQKHHKKQGCEICTSEISCYLADDQNPCTCAWHKNNEVCIKFKNELRVYNAVKNDSDFPNMKVINEFLNYTDHIPDQNVLQWTSPNLDLFKSVTYGYLGWTSEYAEEKFLPIMTSWQMIQLTSDISIDKSSFFYKPLNVVKQCIIQGEDCLKIEWTQNSKEETKIWQTLEFEELFKSAYPELAESFYDSIKKPKKDAQPRKKMSTLTSKNKKIIDFFPVTKKPLNTQDSSKHPDKRSLPSDDQLDKFSPKKLCLELS